jgi:tetratricopeptide (TPR) repeat protein
LSQDLAEKYGYEHTYIIKRIFAWKINALLLLNNYPLVAEELNNKMQEYERFRNDDYIGNLYQLWAKYYLGTGQIDSALFIYRKSFQFNLKIKFKEGCASSLNSIGFLYSEYLKDFPKALDYYFKALNYADERESLSILTNIANTNTREHLFDSAFYYYQKAFDQIHTGMNESALLKGWNGASLNNLAEYLVTLVLDKADAHLYQFKATGKENQLKQTLASYRTADRVLDKIKENQFEMQSKLFWRKSIRRLYEHAIEASWLDKNTEQGFYFFEKGRAVLLDDQLKEDHLMHGRETLEQYQLKTEINRLENERDTTNHHSDRFAIVQTEIIRKKEEQDRLLLKIKMNDPLFFAVNPGMEKVSIKDVQNTILKDHSALVEIFNGDSSVYRLVVTGTGTSISKIDKPSFDSLSQLFLTFISNSHLLNGQFPVFVGVSRKLYDLIFSGNALPTGRIIISPDGTYFPFEALISNTGPETHFMLNDYSISYTYSARFLMSQFTNSTQKTQPDFIGIAPVDYKPYLNLASLPGSDISLNKIQSHFKKGYIAVGSAASKSSFLMNFGNYKIVQLYSHASYNGLNGKPVIYFSDSSLDLSELFSKERPEARLVVLSACETALGKDYKGEGVFSFSREFAALGIPASVSNIWSVDNEATYRVTELFYQFISEGLPTDIALQRAKLQFIKEASREKSLPFYWASPILTGETEVIKTKSAFPFQYVVLFIGIAGLFLLARYKFINR